MVLPSLSFNASRGAGRKAWYTGAAGGSVCAAAGLNGLPSLLPPSTCWVDVGVRDGVGTAGLSSSALLPFTFDFKRDHEEPEASVCGAGLSSWRFSSSSDLVNLLLNFESFDSVVFVVVVFSSGSDGA